MENYEVSLSAQADRDIRAAIRYIAVELRNPQAANGLLDRFTEAVQSLQMMPERFALVSDEYLASLGFQAVVVENYLLFYIVDKQESKVSVVRVLYGRRNWNWILQNE